MKKIIAIAAVACLVTSFANAQKEDKIKDKQKSEKWKDEKWKDEKTIEGSGKVITRDVNVSSFDELDASGVYQLTLIQGNNEAVKIEADDNLQDLFQVKNEGSKLVIDMKEHSNYKSKNHVKVYITFKQLKSMDLKIVGSVKSEGSLNFGTISWDNKSVGSVDLAFNAQKLDLDNKSVGEVTLKGKVNDAVIKNNGVGSLRASDLIVETMDINNNGVGGAEVNATKSLKVGESFMGRVKNVGSATPKKKTVI